MPPVIQETVRVHFKILVDPVTHTLAQRFDLMKGLFESHGVGVEMGTSQRLALGDLEDLAVDECTCGGPPSEDQEKLFRHRDNVPADDVCIYFVRSVDGNNGCATHPPGLPGAVVAFNAPRWTLAHEVGHVLGLCHVNNNRRLMNRSTDTIVVPRPRLIKKETDGMLAHPLTR